MPTSRPPRHDAGGSAEGRGGAPDAHGAGACRAGEGQQEQRHGGGAERGCAGALDDAAGHEHRSVGGGRGQQGADGEQGGAGDEHAATAEQVRGPAGQQQQAAEGEDVGVDDPGDGGGASPRSAWMEGSATLTMEVSSMTTNCADTSSPRATAASSTGGPAHGGAGVDGVCRCWRSGGWRTRWAPWWSGTVGVQVHGAPAGRAAPRPAKWPGSASAVTTVGRGGHMECREGPASGARRSPGYVHLVLVSGWAAGRGCGWR